MISTEIQVKRLLAACDKIMRRLPHTGVSYVFTLGMRWERWLAKQRKF